MQTSSQSSELPFVAPCRKLGTTAALGWLRAGFDDFRRAPRQSLSYGAVMAAISLLVAALGYQFGSYWLLLALASGFIFVAPAFAMGLYAISAALERGERPSLRRCVREGLSHLGDELIFGLILLVVFLIWARAASMLHVFFPIEGPTDVTRLATFLGIGSAVGSVFALIIFSASAFSLPMMMDRRVDAITAVVTSINAVLRNKPAMAVWVAMIVLAVLIGFATALIGFAVTLPLIGHATWHAYREAIDAGAWPEA